MLPVWHTYDDGTVVKWDDPPAKGVEAQPEKPAPHLELVDPKAVNGRHSHSARGTGADVAAGGASAAAGSAVLARRLGGAALVVAVAAAGIAFARTPGRNGSA